MLSYMYCQLWCRVNIVIILILIVVLVQTQSQLIMVKNSIIHSFLLKQECIPVGCVPPAAVAVTGSLHNPPCSHPAADPPGAGTPPPQHTLCRPLEQAPPWQQTPWSGHPPPWTEFLTHASLFAGGKNQLQLNFPLFCLSRREKVNNFCNG